MLNGLTQDPSVRIGPVGIGVGNVVSVNISITGTKLYYNVLDKNNSYDWNNYGKPVVGLPNQNSAEWIVEDPFINHYVLPTLTAMKFSGVSDSVGQGNLLAPVDNMRVQIIWQLNNNLQLMQYLNATAISGFNVFTVTYQTWKT